MITARYIKYALGSLAFCLGIVGLFGLYGQTANIGLVAACGLFGILFMSVVVVRLPVFRTYYRFHPGELDRPTRSYVESLVAPVMSFLVTTGVLGVALYLFGVEDLVLPMFAGGGAAGTMSIYHESRPGWG